MFSFLCTSVVISLSGVMAPGPVTAATLAAGARSVMPAHCSPGTRRCGIPLILLLGIGIGGFLQFPAVKAGIGLGGGVVLILMGVQLLLSIRGEVTQSAAPVQRHPFVLGIVLTGATRTCWSGGQPWDWR